MLSTKVGRLLEPIDHPAGPLDDDGFEVPATHRRVWDFSRDGIRRSLEESLERLGLDRVDIVFLHDPDDHWDDVLSSGYPALAELRDEGVVGAIGAGMNQSRMLADLVRLTDIDVVMLAGRYTLLEQDALDDLLPACAARGVAVVAAGIFNSGLLARPRPGRATRNTTTATPRARSSSGHARSRRCASSTGRRCRPPRSPSRSPIRRSPASASAPARRADRAQRRLLSGVDLSGSLEAS